MALVVTSGLFIFVIPKITEIFESQKKETLPIPDQLHLTVVRRINNGPEERHTLHVGWDENYSAMAKATGYSCCAFVECALQHNLYGLGLTYPERLSGNSTYYKFILDYLFKKRISFYSTYPFMEIPEDSK